MMEYRLMLNEVLEGNMDALEAFVVLKKHLQELETVLKDLQPLAVDEAAKYGEKTFNAFGATVEQRNGASQWKYYGHAFEAAQSNLKYVQDIAKAGGGVHPETGEIIEPAVKVEGKSTIAISFK
jgi:hypothetical protein